MEGRVVVAKSIIMVVMGMILMGERGSGKLIKVGDSWQGWAPDYINFTDWAAHQSFYVGNWIGFWYESKKHDYNVLEVNKTSYEECIDRDFIKNVTGGAGRDVFNLTQPKTYYFLSGGGYCWSGLKIAINVQDIPPPPAPSPAPASTNTSASSPVHVTQILLPIFFCVVASNVIFMFY